MLERGLNTEHHAVAGKYVTFIYNQGGSIIKWYRDTFAAAEKSQAGGQTAYTMLEAELPDDPSPVLVLPHFSVMGPPHFISDSCGAVLGLRLNTSRGQVYKGILEGIILSLRECVDSLPGTDILISDFRAVGGGSRSEAWVQIAADITGRPVVRLRVPEAGALGMALVAGTGTRVFSSLEDGIRTMVSEGGRFEPDTSKKAFYDERFEMFRRLWPLVGGFLRGLREQNERLQPRRPAGAV